MNSKHVVRSAAALLGLPIASLGWAAGAPLGRVDRAAEEIERTVRCADGTLGRANEIAGLSDPAEVAFEACRGRLGVAPELALGLSWTAPRPPYRLLAERSAGHYRVRLLHPEGSLTVTLPELVAAGDVVSGSLRLRGASRGKRTPRALERLRVEIEGRSFAVGDGVWTAELGPESTGSLELAVRNAKGRPVATVRLPLAAGTFASADLFRIVSPVRADRPLLIEGPFDGRAPGTRVEIGSRELELLVETPRRLVASPPGDVGRSEVVVEEAGVGHRLEADLVGVDVDLSPERIDPGESGRLSLRVGPIDSERAGLAVWVVNATPSVVRLVGGGARRVAVDRAGVDADGIFHWQADLVGVRPGVARIVTRLEALPVTPLAPWAGRLAELESDFRRRVAAWGPGRPFTELMAGEARANLLEIRHAALEALSDPAWRPLGDWIDDRFEAATRALARELAVSAEPVRLQIATVGLRRSAPWQSPGSGSLAQMTAGEAEKGGWIDRVIEALSLPRRRAERGCLEVPVTFEHDLDDPVTLLVYPRNHPAAATRLVAGTAQGLRIGSYSARVERAGGDELAVLWRCDARQVAGSDGACPLDLVSSPLPLWSCWLTESTCRPGGEMAPECGP